MRLTLSLAAIYWLCPAPAQADDTPPDKPAPPPATQPATLPATQTTAGAIPAEATTPQGVMLAFIRALEAGDAENAIAACELRGDDDKEMLTAVASATKAHAELRKAIKTKWAEDAPGPEIQVKGLGRIYSEYDFTDAAITEDGDTAKAQLRDNRGSIFLSKQQDAWKISLQACMKDYSGYKPTDVAKTYKDCEEKATKISERLTAGEFESFQVLQDTIDKEEKDEAERARKRKRAGL